MNQQKKKTWKDRGVGIALSVCAIVVGTVVIAALRKTKLGTKVLNADFK